MEAEVTRIGRSAYERLAQNRGKEVIVNYVEFRSTQSYRGLLRGVDRQSVYVEPEGRPCDGESIPFVGFRTAIRYIERGGRRIYDHTNAIPEGYDETDFARIEELRRVLG